ncbi:MAG: BRO-N domain-containing protein [Cetobacterium sp.]
MEKEWFKTKEVSLFLGYRDSERVTRVVSFKENIITHNVGDEINPIGTSFINEFGLYETLCKINKTDIERYNKAREFQKWVFSEVLPSIRQNGAYVDEDHITKEQYGRLKDTLLLF